MKSTASIHRALRSVVVGLYSGARKYALVTCAVLFGLPYGAPIAQSLQWSVEAPQITQDFACYDCYSGEPKTYHAGVDFKDALLNCDADNVPVFAAAAGTVHRYNDNCVSQSPDTCGRWFGNFVLLDLDDGQDLYLQTAHLKTLNSRVALGERFEQGDEIGTMGATGAANGCHTHLQVVHAPNGLTSGVNLADEGMGFEAYPTTMPERNCAGGTTCSDPKELMLSVPLLQTGVATASYLRSGINLGCLAQLQNASGAGDFHVVSIANAMTILGPSHLVFLPSDVGPAEDDTDVGNSACESVTTYGWVPANAFQDASPSYGGMRVNGWESQDLSNPSGRAPIYAQANAPTGDNCDFTCAWPGQILAATQYVQSTVGACGAGWYRVSVPPSRSDGNAKEGWICGDDLEPAWGQCSAQLKGVCSTSPQAITLPASGIQQASATLNLRVNPNGVPTSAHFRWGTSAAALAMATPEQSVGAGTTELPLSATIGGLECAQTYYFAAEAAADGNTATGATNSFVTSPCGDPGGGAVNLILNGDFGDDDDHWIRSGNFYADDRFSGHHDDPGYAYLSEADGDAGNSLVGMLYQQVSIPSNAIEAELEYWVRISTTDSNTTAFDILNATIQSASGQYLSTLEVRSNVHASSGYVRRQFDLADFAGETIRITFIGTTDGSLPTVFRIDDVSLNVVTGSVGAGPDVATLSADQIAPNSARLAMDVATNGGSTSVWFELEAGDASPDVDTPHFAIGSGDFTTQVHYGAGDLACDTQYYFRANAENEFDDDRGSVRSFTTGACPGDEPDADTAPAEPRSEPSRRFTGEVRPNALPTIAWFRWGPTEVLDFVTPPIKAGDGNAFVDVEALEAGLTCGTQYFFNLVAENAEGQDDGVVHQALTLECDGGPDVVFKDGFE